MQCENITFENRKKLYEKWLNNYFQQFKNKKWDFKKEIKEFCENIDNFQYKNNIVQRIDDVNYILVAKDYFEKVENNHDNFIKEKSLALSKILNKIVDSIFKEVIDKTNNYCIVKGDIIYNENLTRYSLKKENRGSIFEIKISNNFNDNEVFKEQFFCFSNSFKKYVSEEDTDVVVTINRNNFDEKIKLIFSNLFEGGNDDIEMFLETLKIKTYLECQSEYEKSKIESLLNKNKDYNISNKKRL